ncbi:acyltransferase [Stenotrophomonas sp. Iso1]|uniref:acyltransferase family protein n=1 Tax=Stenotrophomonas sp. Iso1 TaxID=2977283 RepID=UPI0022B7B4AB|nr:acyltransferase [Stenotrophomonas sp. Iso1]
MRFQSLQALRAIAALGVVLFHLQPYEAKYLSGHSLLGAFARQADSGVDLFFALSGFLMTTLATERYVGPRAALQFLSKRAWRILPTYWLLTIGIAALAFAAPSLIGIQPTGQEIAASLLLLPQAQLPILPVGWTLVHEAYFYLVFAAAIAVVPERFVTAYLIAWAMGVASIGPLLPTDAGSAARLACSPLTLEFIGGALLGIYWRAIPVNVAPFLALIGAAAIVGGMGFVAWGHVAPLHQWQRVAVYGGGAILLIAGMVRMEHAGSIRVPTWLSALGDSSFALYLTHLFVMSAVARIWTLAGVGYTLIQHAAFVIAMVVACYVISRVFYVVVERPLLRLSTSPRREAPKLQRGDANALGQPRPS